MENLASFTVLFMTRSVKNKKLKKERLFARITVEKERVEISLSRAVSIGLFNAKAQCCLHNSKEGIQVNDYLERVKSSLIEIRKKLIWEGKVVTAELIKSRYAGKPDPDAIRVPEALEFYDEHNVRFKELVGTPKHSSSTLKRHLTSRRHVEQFIAAVYKKDDLPLEKINYKFLEDYEHYLKVVRLCCHNSAMKYIKNFAKVVRLAVAEGYMSVNPFDKFKFSYDQVHRVILTQDEVDLLIKMEIKEKRLDRVRDMFVFCIHSGLSYADVRDLKMHHISTDKEGVRWIKDTRQKTGVEYVVPILKINRKIIKKYKDHPQRESEGRVIPEISNQNYNGYLKELAVRCGIEKELTSHIARHTFATTITLDNGVPLEVISKMLGHTDTKTTQIYAKMQDKAIKSGMSNLLNKKKKDKKKKGKKNKSKKNKGGKKKK